MSPERFTDRSGALPEGEGLRSAQETSEMLGADASPVRMLRGERLKTSAASEKSCHRGRRPFAEGSVWDRRRRPNRGE